ncbi:MAG: T9SS type A sorting domain-containing protein, partial [Sulfurovum sp.]|nr:T9SS type A sorting domain-containing protein [Sulfurovum sp.]NNJ45754.1 T9SS type A sorting domain-containing protein [Sulfurovum sp.]
SGAFDGRFVACNEGLFIDIKGTNLDQERIWDIQHQPADGCFPVTLSWDPSELPSGGYFHLVDPFLGTLVNVNMRLRNSYTDDQDLRNLQIKYNYEICSNYSINEGWNMLSLPLGVANSNYLSLFPNAETGTLYGYSDGYFTSDTVGTCRGYWLKFPGTETAQVCGLDRVECTVDLTEGWNMIGGPNCNVPLSSVTDPGGIIIAGTLFGYNGGYFNSSSIDATKAYWVKASGPGTITVSCSAAPLAKTENKSLTIQTEEQLEEFAKIELKDASSNLQRLYFSGKLEQNINIESFSLPPLPPQGAFDVRLAGDYRLSESDEVTIEIQSSDYPVNVKVIDLNQNEVSRYLLKEIVGGMEVGSHRIVSGKDIVISNEEVSLLKITKQQALPTQYSLEQNYPNPFNPSTTIKFSLPEAANVRLTIYNTLGEKVSELVNRNLDAGYHRIEFDASQFASGVYLYRIKANDFVETKKMILMK